MYNVGLGSRTNSQNWQYKFQNASDGNVVASKFFDGFIPSLAADAKPLAAHYGPSLYIQNNLTTDAERRKSYHEFASEDAFLKYAAALSAAPGFSDLQSKLAADGVARVVNVWNPTRDAYPSDTTIYSHTTLYDLGPGASATDIGAFERYVAGLTLQSPPQNGWLYSNFGPALGLVKAASLAGGKTFAYVRDFTDLNTLVSTVSNWPNQVEYQHMLSQLGNASTTSRLDYKFQTPPQPSTSPSPSYSPSPSPAPSPSPSPPPSPENSTYVTFPTDNSTSSPPPSTPTSLRGSGSFSSPTPSPPTLTTAPNATDRTDSSPVPVGDVTDAGPTLSAVGPVTSGTDLNTTSLALPGPSNSSTAASGM
ncbi:MAG: hypothetical protein WDW36_008904 [Sanguina aurantia]